MKKAAVSSGRYPEHLGSRGSKRRAPCILCGAGCSQIINHGDRVWFYHKNQQRRQQQVVSTLLKHLDCKVCWLLATAPITIKPLVAGQTPRVPPGFLQGSPRVSARPGRAAWQKMHKWVCRAQPPGGWDRGQRTRTTEKKISCGFSSGGPRTQRPEPAVLGGGWRERVSSKSRNLGSKLGLRQICTKLGVRERQTRIGHGEPRTGATGCPRTARSGRGWTHGHADRARPGQELLHLLPSRVQPWNLG